VTLTTGRQPAHTLGVGDRYLIPGPDRAPLEVTVARIRRNTITDATTVYHQGSPDRAKTYGPDTLAVITHRAPRPTPAEAFGLGMQPASTLGIGDRYVALGRRDERYRREVTVSYVWDCSDEIHFTVHHQKADPISSSTYTTSSAVHVLHRAERCDHDRPWEDCGFCADVEWPAEVYTAYLGAAEPRAAA
jgi:hypothetical protein